MLFLDVILRYPAITMLCGIAILVLRDARHLLQGRLAAILCLTLAAMFITTAPEILLPPKPAFFALRMFDTANLVFLWWFGLSLFEDDFRLRRLHWAGLAAYLIVGIPLRFNYLMGWEDLPFILGVVVRIISVSMIGHLLWVALSGRRDDLIESRRRVRLWYTIATVISAAIITGGEIAYSTLTGSNTDPEWLSTGRVAVALPAIAFGAYWFLHFRTEWLLFEPVKPAQTREPNVDVKDQASHTRLIAAMGEDKLYREHGLSIGTLASRINVPEHQLRALINKGLGYRNFASFLNTYRLQEAKAVLSDTEQARLPILTIAMDAGYASLATFNRAFKSELGITPSNFRTEALKNPTQN